MIPGELRSVLLGTGYGLSKPILIREVWLSKKEEENT
jgi:hypothetical protein